MTDGHNQFKGLQNFGSLDVLSETLKAVEISFRGKSIWLPKSQVRFTTIVEGPFAGNQEIHIPLWLAASNRMLY